MIRKLLLTVAILMMASTSTGQQLVPDGFDVPPVLETERLRLRMLTVNDVVKDYDAVVSSRKHLQATFSNGSTWPIGLTLEQNLIDLGWHQKEFQIRSSFAYTVVSLDEERVLGCLYIYAFGKAGYNAQVTMWVRSDTLQEGLDEHLFSSVKDWIAEDWPFDKVAFPGRDMTFEEYNRLRGL
jgi:hypothetical protein